MPARRALLACIAIAAASVAGCGRSADRADVRSVADRFYAAIAQDRGDLACAQLSHPTRQQLESQTGQPCDDVVTRLDHAGGEVAAVAVFVTNAKVDMTSGESVFLSLEPEGWRLTAIGCKPPARPRDEPFDCEAEA